MSGTESYRVFLWMHHGTEPVEVEADHVILREDSWEIYLRRESGCFFQIALVPNVRFGIPEPALVRFIQEGVAPSWCVDDDHNRHCLQAAARWWRENNETPNEDPR